MVGRCCKVLRKDRRAKRFGLQCMNPVFAHGCRYCWLHMPLVDTSVKVSKVSRFLHAPEMEDL